MQSAREEKWPSWEKVRRSVHRRSYMIAMTLSCLLLNYDWIRAALWVATRFPGPRSSSLQDVGVNNEFITWPFEGLSQHALPLPWPPPPASVLFFCSDWAISEPRWVSVSTFSAIASSLYSSLNSPWLWLSHPCLFGESLFLALSRGAERGIKSALSFPALIFSLSSFQNQQHPSLSISFYIFGPLLWVCLKNLYPSVTCGHVD